MHGADTLALSVWKVWWNEPAALSSAACCVHEIQLALRASPPTNTTATHLGSQGHRGGGASTSEVLAYLTHVRDQIGVDPDEDRDRDTAVTIVDWYRASTLSVRRTGIEPDLGTALYTRRVAQAPALLGGFELPLEPRLPRIGSVDAVALEERAATLAKRSIKRESKLQALELAIRMMDLTTLEGQDTPGKVAALCAKGMRPDPVDPSIPSVAAICIYPNLVATAKERVAGSGVRVASVATAFPSGQSPIELKVAETRAVVELGADEVDMVIDRGAFLSGRYAKVYDEIVRVKEACGTAHLKVILETGELGTYDNVRRASLLAMAAGADFVKTSTGKINPAATLPVTLCMMEAVRDVYTETGRMVGIKPAGGIRVAKQAVQYLVVLYETLGGAWMTPELFRFGASSLLNDVLMQIRKEKTGRYQSGDYFTID